MAAEARTRGARAWPSPRCVDAGWLRRVVAAVGRALGGLAVLVNTRHVPRVPMLDMTEARLGFVLDIT